MIDRQNNIGLYGETSYDNMMAVMSHYMHHAIHEETTDRKIEIIAAIREFMSRNQCRQCPSTSHDRYY